MAAVKNKIIIVGCGPGGADYLTRAACLEIGKAEVLVGAQRLLDLFPDSKAKRVILGADLDLALDEMEICLGKRVAVLVSGDPGLCSFAGHVIKHFGRKTCSVLPGISSVQTAFARIGVDWFDVRIIHAHSRIPKVNPKALCGTKRIAILVGHKGAAGWLTALAGVLGNAYRVFVCRNLTMPDERVREIKPGSVKTLKFAGQQIILWIHKEIF